VPTCDHQPQLGSLRAKRDGTSVAAGMQDGFLLDPKRILCGSLITKLKLVICLIVFFDVSMGLGLLKSLNLFPRASFPQVLERASQDDGFGDSELVHYGQDFVLRFEAFADMSEDT